MSGASRVKAFRFADDTVATITRHYSLDRIPAQAERRNTSTSGDPASTSCASPTATRSTTPHKPEYFAERDDLLVLDLERGQGWPELCSFLDVVAPDHPFPHINRT